MPAFRHRPLRAPGDDRGIVKSQLRPGHVAGLISAMSTEGRPASALSASDPPPALTDFLLLPVLYFVAARIGVALSVMPNGMAILWPPNGVLLAYFIRFGPRNYAIFGALAVIAELAVDVPKYRVADAFLFGLINVAEVAIASTLLGRAQFNPRFTHLSDLAKFVGAAPVTGAFIGALFGAFVYSRMPGTDTVYLQLFRIWWFGDALGMMIIAPLFLSAWTHTRNLPRWPTLCASDAVVAIGAIGVVGLLLAAREGTLMGTHVGPVLLLPFAIFVGVRLGPSAAAITVSAVTLLILALTTQGRNPFGADAPRDAVIHAQEFVFVLSVMTLGLATLVWHVRASQSDLEMANQELRRQADALSRSNLEMQLAKAEVVALNAALEQRVLDRTRDLQEALTQVKQLAGLLPICAWCKAVRDDRDYWHSVEEYISERTEARFTHGICPKCATEIYKSAQFTDRPT
jgi:integral membrane sensor domain MASE1